MRLSKNITAAGLLLAASVGASAAALPGAGIRVQPLQSTLAEESFQTQLVNKALAALGYEVAPIQEVDYNVAYTSIANGDATFMAVNWDPQQKDKYLMAGGDEAFFRKGEYVSGAAQGYMIDKKSAEQYGITQISQLADPELAKLFDADGDGKADLAGCNPGWTCDQIIDHHLQAYGLSQTVSHHQGNYAAIIADTIARYQNGQPVLYYAWIPYWVSGVLVPGKDVVWLQVPFSAMPGVLAGTDTTLPNGANYGFEMNNMRIVAHRAFAEANPAAAKLFEIMKLPINDISAQNMRMRQGENSEADINRHVEGWIKAHQATFDGWIQTALATSAKP